MPLEPGADGHEAGVRTAVEQRDAEPLAGADHHVGAERRRAPRAAVSASRSAATTSMAPRSWACSAIGRGSITLPAAPGYCSRTPHNPVSSTQSGRPSVRSASATSMPMASGPGLHHLDGLRKRVGVDDERPLGLAVRAAYERHRLGRRGALVEQAGVGGGQPGQVPDHGLEVEQRLEAALRDLGLVGRVRGVPARVLEHVAPDHRRRDRGVVAEPDHRLGRVVLRSERPQLAGHGELARRRGQPRGRRSCGCRRALPPPSARRAMRSRRLASIVSMSSGRRPMCRSTKGSAPSSSVIEGWSDTGWAPQNGIVRALPLCRPTVEPSELPVRAVLAPERFRGGVAPSALRSGTSPTLGTRTGDSPVRDGQRCKRTCPRRYFPTRDRGGGQPAVRAARRAASSSPGVGSASSAARSLGSSARVPSISRQTPPIAMPKTPWPPWSRSMTSSLLVHS